MPAGCHYILNYMKVPYYTLYYITILHTNYIIVPYHTLDYIIIIQWHIILALTGNVKAYFSTAWIGFASILQYRPTAGCPLKLVKPIPWFFPDSFSKTGWLLTIYWPCSKDCKGWTKLRWFSPKKVDIFIIYHRFCDILYHETGWKFPDVSPTCFCKIPWFSPDFLPKFPVFPDCSLYWAPYYRD